MGQKFALLIGNSDYQDPRLSKLALPESDVAALARVLDDPAIGGFDEISQLINRSFAEAQRAIGGFLAGRKRDDLLLLYFAGHGVRDDEGHLYLALKDTETANNLVTTTAVPASLITREMDRCRSRQQVLILDCCHSGAFARGARAATGARVGTAATFEGTGTGRVVLTATDETQFAFEGDEVIGEAENSVFTRHLVGGLVSGKADVNGNGAVTVDELYEYVHARVIDETPRQTPGKWTYKQQGDIVIARNPKPVVTAAELPADLQEALASDNPFQLVGVVQGLDELLKGDDKAMALAAREALERLGDHDSRRVSGAAETVLANDDGRAAAAQPRPAAEIPSDTALPVSREHLEPEPLPPAARKPKKRQWETEHGIDYAKLDQLLSHGRWKDADRETLAVMCRASGKDLKKGLSIDDVAAFPCRDLETVDRLWLEHSDGRYGFSVQRRCFEEAGRDQERFGDLVGWRVNKLWIYFADVHFDLSPPDGHLPIGGPGGLTFDSKWRAQYAAPLQQAKSEFLDLVQEGGLKRLGKRSLAGVVGETGFSLHWMEGRLALLSRLECCGILS